MKMWNLFTSTTLPSKALVALTVAGVLGGLTACNNAPTPEDLIAPVSVVDGDGMTDNRLAAIRAAGVVILEGCPDLASDFKDFDSVSLFYTNHANAGLGQVTLNERGWSAMATLQYSYGDPIEVEYVSLGQGADGRPGGLFAYGTKAQTACDLPATPLGQLITPLDVTFLLNE